MARDYLAIPGSSSVSEQLFSIGGVISTLRRLRLAPATTEALQIIRRAYDAGDDLFE
jgi:hypothetical protein